MLTGQIPSANETRTKRTDHCHTGGTVVDDQKKMIDSQGRPWYDMGIPDFLV